MLKYRLCGLSYLPKMKHTNLQHLTCYYCCHSIFIKLAQSSFNSITTLTYEHEQLQNFVIKDEISLIEAWMFNIINDHLK